MAAVLILVVEHDKLPVWGQNMPPIHSSKAWMNFLLSRIGSHSEPVKELCSCHFEGEGWFDSDILVCLLPQ